MDRVNCEELEETLAGLALNPRELSAQEREALLAQLDDCPGSRERYEDYLRISTGLLHAIPTRVPPPALKANLMARVHASTPPVVKQPNFFERLWQWVFGPVRVPRIAIGAAVAVFVGTASVLGAQVSSLSRQNGLQGGQLALMATREADQQTALANLATRSANEATQAQQQAQLLEILSDTQAHSVSLGGQDVAPKAKAKMQFNPTHNTAVLSLDDLPALSDNQVYQLWLFDPNGTALPSITFPADAKNVLVNADAQFGNYKNFAISVEPSGGSVTRRGPVALLGLP